VFIASVITVLAGLLMPAVRAEGLEHDAAVAADAELADAELADTELPDTDRAGVAADTAGRAAS
jgi:hypothetical protein